MEFIPYYLSQKYGHLSWAELAERLHQIEERLRREELEEALRDNCKKMILIDKGEYKL